MSLIFEFARRIAASLAGNADVVVDVAELLDGAERAAPQLALDDPVPRLRPELQRVERVLRGSDCVACKKWSLGRSCQRLRKMRPKSDDSPKGRVKQRRTLARTASFAMRITPTWSSTCSRPSAPLRRSA